MIDTISIKLPLDENHSLEKEIYKIKQRKTSYYMNDFIKDSNEKVEELEKRKLDIYNNLSNQFFVKTNFSLDDYDVKSSIVYENVDKFLLNSYFEVEKK